MEERYRIHAAYILTILITAIILLLTIQWSGIPALAEKLTFALTVLSVIVSLPMRFTPEPARRMN